jgi:hypothetical protein
MELLILKSDEDYIRVKEGGYICCRLDKASVYPMGKLEQVRRHAGRLRESGFCRVSICRLKLWEEPFEGDDVKE